MVNNIEDNVGERDFTENKFTHHVRHSELNNVEFKQYFIDNIDNFFKPAYKKLVEDLMYKISTFEIKSKDKRDTYTFDLNEIQELYLNFRSKSPTTLQVYTSILKKYVDFAISNGRCNTNYFNNLNYNNLVNLLHKGKNKNKLFNREFVYLLAEEKIQNKVDKIIVLLIYEGIRGKACQDVINIKMEDVNIQDSIIIINGKVRVVPRRLMNIIESVDNQTTYAYNNNECTGDRQNMITDLISRSMTPYLIRPTEREYMKDGNLKMTSAQLQSRTNKLFKTMNYPFVTLQNIYDSGVVNRAIEYGKKEYGNEMMKMNQFKEFLNENDIGANLTTKYNLYKEFYEKEIGNK